MRAMHRAGALAQFKEAADRLNLAELNGDTIELARLGSNLFKQSALNEKGDLINGVGDTPNMHDMLTGSQTDGRAYTDSADHTCNNWTSSGAGSAQVGHSDRTGAGNTSWNSAHPSRGCSQEALSSTGGAGCSTALRAISGSISTHRRVGKIARHCNHGCAAPRNFNLPTRSRRKVRAWATPVRRAALLDAAALARCPPYEIV